MTSDSVIGENKGTYITLARVVKPQGNKGEVAAYLTTDFPEKFAERKKLFALFANGTRRELTLEDYWPHKGRIILKLAGVDSINDAELLKGCELQVPLQERVKLQAGSYFVSDLVGCEVFDTSGGSTENIGHINHVQFDAGDAPLLTVAHGANEHMVPFAEDYIMQVDTVAKRIELKLPEGLLELNNPVGKKAGEKNKL